MPEQNQRAIEEMFMIKTDAIELVGSLIRETTEGFSSKGTVHFRDGTLWGFQSPRGERSEIRERLMSIFERTAAFYRAEVIYHNFQKAVPQEKLYSLTHATNHLLH